VLKTVMRRPVGAPIETPVVVANHPSSQPHLREAQS
jgi:hypothetical protein